MDSPDSDSPDTHSPGGRDGGALGDGGGTAAPPPGTYRDARAKAVDDFERAYLQRLISACAGNASEAARVARMDRPHLLRMLRRHNLR